MKFTTTALLLICFSSNIRRLKVQMEIGMRFYLWKSHWLCQSQVSHSSSFAFYSLVIWFFELQIFPVYSSIVVCSNMYRYWIMMGLLRQGKLLALKTSISIKSPLLLQRGRRYHQQNYEICKLSTFLGKFLIGFL